MEAIRINQKLESETLVLPQLRPWLGQNVEIIVLAPDALPAKVSHHGQPGRSLAGSVLRDDDPFGPAVPPEAWEANR